MQITSSCLVLLLTFGDWKESVDELEITGDWGVCVSSSSSWEMYSAILTNTFYNYDKYITVDWCVCVSWSLTRLGGQRRRRARCCHFGWLGWGEGRLEEVYSNTIIFFDKSLDGLNELFAFCICKKGRFRKWPNFFLFWKVCELNCERLRKSKTWLIFKDFLCIGFQIGAECSAAPLIRGSGSGGWVEGGGLSRNCWSLIVAQAKAQMSLAFRKDETDPTGPFLFHTLLHSRDWRRKR